MALYCCVFYAYSLFRFESSRSHLEAHNWGRVAQDKHRSKTKKKRSFAVQNKTLSVYTASDSSRGADVVVLVC